MTGEDARVHAMAALNLVDRLESAAPEIAKGRDLFGEKAPITLLAEAIEGARRAYLRMLDISVILEREERRSNFEGNIGISYDDEQTGRHTEALNRGEEFPS